MIPLLINAVVTATSTDYLHEPHPFVFDLPTYQDFWKAAERSTLLERFITTHSQVGAQQSAIAYVIASRWQSELQLDDSYSSDFGKQKVLSGFYDGVWRSVKGGEWFTVGDEQVSGGLEALSPQFYERGAYKGKVAVQMMFDAVLSGENSNQLIE